MKEKTGNKLRIIVVEDQTLIREGLTGLFQKKGHEVVGEASDGLEAIKLADELLPDIISMDLSMPRMSGIEATKKIKEKHGPDKIKIMALTISNSPEVIAESLAAGIDSYVVKNCSFDELVYALEETAKGNKYFSEAVFDEIMGRNKKKKK